MAAEFYTKDKYVADVQVDGTSVLNEDNVANFETADVRTGVVVNDVKINDSSIVQNGVANIPKATSSLGLVGTYSGYGSGVNSSGILMGVKRSFNQYTEGNDVLIISKGTLENIKSDLVKRAITDSSQAEYTDDEKASVRERIGAEKAKGEWVLKGTISGDETDRGNIDTGVNIDLSGCTELTIIGYATGSANTHLYTNLGYIHFNAFKNGTRCIFDKFIFDGLSTVPTVCKYEDNKTTAVTFNVSGNYEYVRYNKQISEITNVSVVPTNSVVSCDIQIYAR